MAENNNSLQNIDSPQVVGNVSIVNGTVQAESANGETRVLAHGAQIFANDRIITGEDGAISIVFLDPGQTQLDLGRMSDMVLTEDVFQAGFPTDLEEATADIEQIQEALLSGEFDPTTDLEATAAGPAAGGGERGGGRTILRFDTEGREVTPESGAETTGIERDFSATDPSPIEEIEEAPVVAAAVAAVGGGGGGGGEEFTPTPVNRVVEEEALEWRSDYFDENYSDWPFGSQGIFSFFQSQGNPDDVRDLWDPEHNPTGPDDIPQDSFQPDVRVVTGSLDGQLVQAGTSDFSIISTASLPELLSKGEEVQYEIGPDGSSLLAFVGGFGGPAVAALDVGSDEQESFRPIFTLEVLPNGEYRFILYDQLDHVAPSGDVTAEENVELLSGGISAIDFSSILSSGGVGFASGLFNIAVTDDIPTVNVEAEQIGFSVYEDSMNSQLTNEGDPETDNNDLSDGTFPGNIDDEQQSGPGQSVANLFNIGADEVSQGYFNDFPNDGGEQSPSLLLGPGGQALGTYGITQDQSILDSLSTLLSHGESVLYKSDGQILTAYVPGSDVDDTPTDTTDIKVAESTEERVIFTFRVDPDTGQWYFDLEDQLDHVDGDGYNTALKTSLEDIEGLGSLDLSSILTATDYDGDMITGAAIGGLAVEVVDDIPRVVANGETGKVDEDDLDTKWSTGTDDSDPDADGPRVITTGTLNGTAVVSGADEPLTFSFADDFTSLEEQGLTSQDDSIFYRINGDGDLVGRAPNGDDSNRTVFKLQVDEDGNYKFILYDQLDHEDSDGQNSLFIDFSGVVQATDFDNDTVTLSDSYNPPDWEGEGDGDKVSFQIEVIDDVPILTGEVENAKVDEDDLDTKFSTGTDDNDPGYGPAVTATGSLAALVTVGADEPPTFSFADSFQSLIDQGLTSQSDALTYKINGDGDLVAQATDEGGETRNVFKLELDDDGSYKFILKDQLDHPDGLDENSLHVDFSGVVDVTDFDEDTVNLGSLIGEDKQTAQLFTVEVVDDIPILSGDKERGLVDEDDLDTKFSTGTDGGDDPGYGPAVTTTGSLSDLVTVGADEPLTFSFADNFQALIDQGLTSQSDTLTYKINGNGDLVAQATDEGGETRNVFKLELDDDGDYTFTLKDQLDHPDADGQNLLKIDLSGVINATDFDQDTVNLGELKDSEFDAKAFIIKVVDDVPESEFTGTSFFVSEFAGYDNIIGTYRLDENGDPTDAKIFIDSTNDEVPGNKGQLDPNTPKGDYEEGTKFFLIANGVNNLDSLNLNNLQFVQTGGSPAWALEIDGSTGYAPPVYYMDVALNADGYVHFKDENGQPLSEIPPEGGEIRIEDLSLGDADYDDTVLRVQVGPSVDEANLPDGTDPDAGELSVSGNIFTGEGGLKITTGSDEPGTIIINGNTITTTNTGGNLAASSPLLLDGNVANSITVDSDAGQLVINGDGSWTYTLQQNTIVHPDNNPGGTDPAGDGDSDRGTGDQVQDIFDISFTDFDGDEINPQLVININDDGPEAATEYNAVVDSVQEDDMNSDVDPKDNSIGIDEDGSVTEDETFGPSGSIAQLFNIGADNGVDDPGSVTYGISTDYSSLGNLQSNGEALGYSVNSDGDLLTASTSQGVVFTLKVEESGDWHFDLRDQLDHVDDNDGFATLPDDENWELIGSTAPDANGIDFSSVLTATDTDGDTAYGAADNSFIIKVQDDIPEAKVPDGQIPGDMNLVLILDNSGSMYSNDITFNGDTKSRAEALKLSVTTLLTGLATTGLAGATYKVHIVEYNTDASVVGTFTIEGGNVLSATTAVTAVNGLSNAGSPGYYTNYEAGFQQALQWTDGSDPLSTPGVVNEVLFISDGDPNRHNSPDYDGDHHPTSSGNDLDPVLGSDGTDEQGMLDAWADNLRAIGIAVDGNQLGRLSQLDGTGTAENITTGDALSALLPELLNFAQPIILAQVQEDDLHVDGDSATDPDNAIGINEDNSDNQDEATSNNLSALFISGADEELTFNLFESDADLPELYSGGNKLVYSFENDVLTAKADGDVIFTFSVSTNGTWKFDLDGPLDHVNDGNNEENWDLISGAEKTESIVGIDLSSLVVATDADGDAVPAATGAFVVQIQDDVPALVSETHDAILANEAGNELLADLGIDFGSDGADSITIRPDDDNVGSNSKVLDSNGDVVRLDGAKLFWVNDPATGSVSAQTNQGKVAFTVAPEFIAGVFTGNYTVDQVNDFGTTEAASLDYFSFFKGGGGPAESKEISFNDDDVKIIVTADSPNPNPDKINWSNKGLGVDNNHINEIDDVSETMIFNFEDFTGDPLDILSVTFRLNHLEGDDQGDSDNEWLHWEAYEESGDLTASQTGSLEGYGTGASGYQEVTIDLSGSNTFQEIKLSIFQPSASEGEGYRVQGIEINYDSPVDYEFDFIADVTDGDGDTVSTEFDVTFDAGGDINGGSESEVIVGSMSGETIRGGGGDDVIFGKGGDDTLYGQGGEDILVGGTGEDILRGGADADILTGEDVEFGADGLAQITNDGESDSLNGGPGSDIGTDIAMSDDDLETLILPPNDTVV